MSEKSLMVCLRSGATVVVKSLDHGHRSSKKLIDMGFTPGTAVSLSSVAPLGDPCLLNIRDYKLAVRKKDLRAIEFEIRN